MTGKGFKPEQIANKLHEADILLIQGCTVAEASRRLGINDHTFYHWRKEYGGMRGDQAKRLQELEKENIRLKKLVADISLDNSILKKASHGNSEPLKSRQDVAFNASSGLCTQLNTKT